MSSSKRMARRRSSPPISIVFVVDGREGLIPGDEDIAKATRDAGVPVILAINKSDDRRARDAALEFSRLGFDRIVEISAEHGQGVGDLLEVIIEHLEPPTAPRPCGTPWDKPLEDRWNLWSSSRKKKSPSRSSGDRTRASRRW